MEYIGFVYKWVNLINGKMYVGSHVGRVDDGYIGSGTYFVAAINKYGIDSFKRQILHFEFNSAKELYQKEFDIINELNAVFDTNYYNQKNTCPHAFKWGVLGEYKQLPFTDSHKQNLSNARTGKKDTVETKLKKYTSSSIRGKKYFNNQTAEYRYTPGTEPLGWIRGRLPGQIPDSGKGAKYYNNGTIVKRFRPGTEPLGWVLGNLGKTSHWGDNNPSKRQDVKDKISKAQIGVARPQTSGNNNPSKRQDVKDKISLANKGKVNFNNGIIVKRFTPGEDPVGWTRGNIKRKNNEDN